MNKAKKYISILIVIFSVLSIISVVNHSDYIEQYFSGFFESVSVIVLYIILIAACLWYIIKPPQ